VGRAGLQLMTRSDEGRERFGSSPNTPATPSARRRAQGTPRPTTIGLPVVIASVPSTSVRCGSAWLEAGCCTRSASTDLARRRSRDGPRRVGERRR
jgi:hypothetical protein